MKKIAFISLAALSLLSGGCSDDEPVIAASVDEITLSEERLHAGPEGVEAEITVASSSDWRIAGSCDWITLSSDRGASGSTVVFSVAANDSGKSREATFKFFAGSAVIPFTVTSDPVYRLALFSSAKERFDTQAGSLCVRLDTNMFDLSPEIVYGNMEEDEVPWIVFLGQREAFGAVVLNFSVAANTGYRTREARISVGGGDDPIEVAVSQAKNERLEIDAKESYQFDLQQSTFAVDVLTSVDYEVRPDEKCESWIHWEVKLLSDDKGLRSERIEFTVDEARASRSGMVEIFNKRDAWKPVAEFKVAQKDPNAVNVDIPDANFAKWLLSEGWISEEGEGIYIATEKGLTSTELVFNPSRSRDKAESVEGITAFPELVKIDVSKNELSSIDFTGLTKLQEIYLNDNNLRSIDLSALTTVTKLECYDNPRLSAIDLGRNPIKTFAVFTDEANDGSIYGFEEMTLSGELLEELNIAIFDRSNVRYDGLETLDLSGCPALQTLDCRRGSSFKTLILKAGQTIPNLQKKDTTEITYK